MKSVRLLIVGGAALLLPVCGVAVAGLWIGPETKASAAAMGSILIPLFLVVAVLTTGLGLAPTHLVSLLSGYLFGFSTGLMVALGSVTGGAAVGFGISRRLTENDLQKWIEKWAFGRSLYDAMIGSGWWSSLSSVTLARLPPQVPFALGNVLAGSVGVSLLPFVLGTMAGMLPRVALVVWVGAELSAWESGADIPSSLYWSIGLSLIGLGGLGIWGARIVSRGRTGGDASMTVDNH